MRQLAIALTERAAASPDRVAVIDAEGEHTLGEVMEHATALADALASAVAGAPTVLLQADNSWRTMAGALAIGLRGGLVAVVSRHATPSEIALALEDLEPDAVVAAPGTLGAWGETVLDLEPTSTVLSGWTLAARPHAVGGVDRWNGGSVVAMTSGSTGRPKCVVQSEEALLYAARCTIDAVGLEAGDGVAALVPLSSVAAICFGMYLPATLGGIQICLDGWEPALALQVMERHRARWTMLVPTMALQLSLVPQAAGTLAGMRAMTVGGGPMNAAALERAETTLGTTILRVFGMSECLGHTTPLPSESAEVRLGRDGRPFPGTQLRAVDADGTPLGVGAVGEAQVRGPSLFVGYARSGKPELPTLTADGFLPTGDRLRVNEDGTVNILGREKQIIIRGGRNIDINEVEAAVAAIPVVAQVCVVPVPDDLLGERAAALVVTTAPLTLDDVRTQLDAAGVPKFKWPEFVHVVPSLPQNRVGKLSRPDAVALAIRLGADSSEPPTQ